MEGWRDGWMEDWMDEGMEGWRDGGLEGWRFLIGQHSVKENRSCLGKKTVNTEKLKGGRGRYKLPLVNLFNLEVNQPTDKRRWSQLMFCGVADGQAPFAWEMGREENTQ